MKNPKKERKNEKSFPVSDVFIHTCCVFIISGCVFRSIPLLFCMCMRMTSSSRSIAEVPSGQTLQSYPITVHHLYAFLVLEGYRCGGITNQKPKTNSIQGLEQS